VKTILGTAPRLPGADAVQRAGLILLCLLIAVSAPAQAPSGTATNSNTAASAAHQGHGGGAPGTNTTRINPHGPETQTLAEILAGRPSAPTNLYPRKDWGLPMDDRMRHFFFLADELEYRPKGSDSDFRWDIESWYGGDFNRVWLKSEGEKSTTEEDYDLDVQLLYGRFLKKYYDFQIGARAETRIFRGHNETRAHAVIGLEGLVPYRFEVEPLLFISEDGDVSARFTGTRDLLLTQRLILQGRLETKLAIQEVKKFAVGTGLNNIEVGLRLRYEIRREFAPYIGVSYERSLFGTEDLVRREGGDPNQFRFVAGLRIWF
jgi:copper resistance protein B